VFRLSDTTTTDGPGKSCHFLEPNTSSRIVSPPWRYPPRLQLAPSPTNSALPTIQPKVLYRAVLHARMSVPVSRICGGKGPLCSTVPGESLVLRITMRFDSAVIKFPTSAFAPNTPRPKPEPPLKRGQLLLRLTSTYRERTQEGKCHGRSSGPVFKTLTSSFNNRDRKDLHLAAPGLTHIPRTTNFYPSARNCRHHRQPARWFQITTRGRQHGGGK
jgi:hypothetical protein